MRFIKVIYDDGSNELTKVHIKAKKQHKKISEMSAQEIMATGFGMFR